MSGETQPTNGIFVAGFVIGGLLGAAVALIVGARLARGLTQPRTAPQPRSAAANGSAPRSSSYFGDEPAESRDENETPRIVLDRGNGVTGLTNGDGPAR